jgi:hypothetical protein
MNMYLLKIAIIAALAAVALEAAWQIYRRSRYWPEDLPR